MSDRKSWVNEMLAEERARKRDADLAAEAAVSRIEESVGQISELEDLVKRPGWKHVEEFFASLAKTSRTLVRRAPCEFDRGVLIGQADASESVVDILSLMKRRFQPAARGGGRRSRST